MTAAAFADYLQDIKFTRSRLRDSLAIVMESRTRWLYHFRMIERILILRPWIAKLPDVAASANVNPTELTNLVTDLNWCTIESFSFILSSIARWFVYLEGENYETGSAVWLSLVHIKRALKFMPSDSTIMKAFKQVAWSEIQVRCGPRYTDPLTVAIHMLDPRNLPVLRSINPYYQQVPAIFEKFLMDEFTKKKRT